MSQRGRVPDAWDEDYEAVADQPPRAPQPSNLPPPKLTRAERREQHTAANRALWNSADNPETFHYVEAKSAGVPLQNDFKPQLKLLSRKPQAQQLQQQQQQQQHGSTGLERAMNGVSLASRPDPAAADEPDSEEEERREQDRLLKERQERAKKEREEKQKRYDEVRARLFGPSSPNQSGSSSPQGRNSPTRGGHGGGGGRGTSNARRGSGRGQQQQPPQQSQQQHQRGSPQHGSSAEHSPARVAQQHGKQLFEPSYSPKPGSSAATGQLRKRQDSDLVKPVRAPKGPDGSGRGGFGFAPRGRGTKVP